MKPGRFKEPKGTWALISPLLALLAVLVISVIGLSAITDVRIVGPVVFIVPVIALVWLMIQHCAQTPVESVAGPVRDYVVKKLPGYREELTLPMMAGYIRHSRIGPARASDAAWGLDLSVLPAWVILVT